MQDYELCSCQECAIVPVYTLTCRGGHTCPMDCSICDKHAKKQKCNTPDIWQVRKRKEKAPW